MHSFSQKNTFQIVKIKDNVVSFLGRSRIYDAGPAPKPVRERMVASRDGTTGKVATFDATTAHPINTEKSVDKVVIHQYGKKLFFVE